MAEEKTTRANGRARRQLILDTALGLFAERGYRGTSLNEISARVGMTQPGLTHHFGSKDKLLLEVVRNREERTSSRVNPHFTDRFEVREAILDLAAVNEAARVEQLLLTTLSAEAIPTEHPLHDHFVARYQDTRSRLGEALRRAQAHGDVRADLDTDRAAREIVATLDGLHLQWLLDPAEINLTEVLGAYAEDLEVRLRP